MDYYFSVRLRGLGMASSFANRIRTRHATVHAMLEASHSRRSIGRQLHMTHRTVESITA
jgi:hypothetical protein